METFLIRHTIPMPRGEEPLRRHYSTEANSKESALEVAYKIDDGTAPGTVVEVIGHVVNGWPDYDL
jgi:hypothetical protein